jgi:hypothetical protein
MRLHARKTFFAGVLVFIVVAGNAYKSRTQVNAPRKNTSNEASSAKHLLRLHLKKGQKFSVQVAYKEKGTSKYIEPDHSYPGRIMSGDRMINVRATVTVISVHSRSEANVRITIDSMSGVHKAGWDGKMQPLGRFNSDKPRNDNPYTAIKGQSVYSTLVANGQLLEIEGINDIIDNAGSDTGEHLRDVIRVLCYALQPSFPNQPVAVGQTWKQRAQALSTFPEVMTFQRTMVGEIQNGFILHDKGNIQNGSRFVYARFGGALPSGKDQETFERNLRIDKNTGIPRSLTFKSRLFEQGTYAGNPKAKPISISWVTTSLNATITQIK